MADITTFPIPNKVLDPEDYPEFKGDAGPATEWRSTATHLQARPVGGSTWVDVVALSDITVTGVPLTGATSIAVVDEYPDPQVAGVLYIKLEAA